MQMKEAEASVLEEFLGPSQFSNHGERVVVGQRLMQAVSDIFLGWLHVDSGLDGKPRDFYGRQLKDWKGSARSPPTSATTTASTARSSNSPRPTPTRTNATTRR